MAAPTIVPSADVQTTVDWRAAIAGAVVAAGVSTTFLAFGSGIGLSTASAAPTWRDTSPTLWAVSGLYLIFTALCSFGAGGYVAGRMRGAVRTGDSIESGFRDGLHGIVSWALAVIFTAMLAVTGVALAARSTDRPGSGTVTGESAIASEIDELFRGAKAPTVDRRDEVARILLKGSSHDGVPQQDRTYLAALVSSETGVQVPEATRRVEDIIGKSVESLHRARQAGVMQAFLIGVALVLGAGIAWFAATEGGEERERGIVPRWGASAKVAVRR